MDQFCTLYPDNLPQSLLPVDSDRSLNHEQSAASSLFLALFKGNNKKVERICSNLKDGALHKCTIHNSTAFHLACYYEKYDLAETLLKNLSDNQCILLCEQRNSWGSTVLHDASVSDKGCEFVKKLLSKVPNLLLVLNKWDESAVFVAIAYGNTNMYQTLVEAVETKFRDHRLHFFRRKDEMTILHLAILTRQFGIALDIARRFPELCNLEDKKGRTALQMLARCPTAFKSGANLGRLENLVYSTINVGNDEQELQDTSGLHVGDDEQDTTALAGLFRKAINFILGTGCCTFPVIENVKKLKRDHVNALKLANILIKKDESWNKTSQPLNDISLCEDFNGFEQQDHKREDMASGKDKVNKVKEGEISGKDKDKDNNEAPLFLATKTGCVEIVEGILNTNPSAVDYLNSNQENLLHVAIKSRNRHFYQFFHKKKLPNEAFKGLYRAVDRHRNSILHMVGLRPTTLGNVPDDTEKESKAKQSQQSVSLDDLSIDTKITTPLQELSDDLTFLEELENNPFCPPYLRHHRNVDNLTARELFAQKRETLRQKAKEYLKNTSEQCTVVIVLIATVAFAAAYTVPGGPDEKTGLPVLLGKPLFLVFSVTDVLSLGFALTAVIVFLTIHTSPFRLEDFQRSLPQKLQLGFTLLFFSVSMMMVSFAATIILTVNSKQQWAKITLYIVTFLPVIIFMLFYAPFYKEVFPSLGYCVIKVKEYFPKIKCLGKPASSSTPSKCV